MTQSVAHVAVGAVDELLAGSDLHLAHPGEDLLRLVEADHRDRVRIELPDVVNLGVVGRRIRIVDDLLYLILRDAGLPQVVHRVVGQAAAVRVVTSQNRDPLGTITGRVDFSAADTGQFVT